MHWLDKATMKPNFALDLSHDGISLLHRNDGSKAGWSLVGEVALDDPEMTAKLDMLRKTAAGLDQGGVATKLVIPASQILFTEVSAPANDDITREVQIRAALDGLTPYEVGELVFDWRRAKGKAVKVAVVARETLQEAETFAKEHKFNPVSFVARGKNGFKGEVFFGMAPSASALLGAGEKVEPDTKPVPRIASLRPKAPGDSEKTEAEPDTGPDGGPDGGGDTVAQGQPDAKPDTKPEGKADSGSDTTSAAKAAPAAEKSEPPAPSDQAAKGTPAPASGDADTQDADTQKEDAQDEDARIAALLAEVPEPEPRNPAASTDLAGKKGGEKDGADKASAKSPAAARAGKPKVPPAPVLAPFPPSLDREDAARQAQKPAAKAEKKATKSAAKAAAKMAGKAEKSAKTGKTGSRNIPPPPSRREIPPLAKNVIDGARQDEAAQRAKAPAAARSGIGAGAKAEPAPPFASRRHISASGEVQKADLDAPGAVTPQPQAQEKTKKQAQKQARLRAMEMALAKAPAQANGAELSAQDSGKRRANGTIPPLPPRATIPAAATSSAGTASQARPALTSDSTDGMAGGLAQGQAGKAGQLQARLQRGASSAAQLSRAAAQAATKAAAKAAKGLIKRRQPAPDSSNAPAKPATSAALGPASGMTAKAKNAGLPPARADKANGASPLTPGIADDAASPAIDTAIAPGPAAFAAPSEAERLTLFGARRAQQGNIGGKPRFLGLVLTLVLLLFMAVIALASVFLLGDDDTTGGTGQPASSDFAAASVPEALLPSPADGTSAALAPLPDAAPPSGPPSGPRRDTGGALAALPGAAQSPGAPEIITDPIAPLPAQTAQAAEPAPAPAAPRSPEVLSEEAAQTRYAATGIWEKAPQDPPEPRGSRIDDLYIASIDPKITGTDAVSLPPVAPTAPESRPATPLPPAPPGTTFALSDNGLVAPSPEGTLSPEGILVFSGKPEVVPPPRPGVERPEILPDDALRAIRPKPRPTGLIEENQRANNGGNTLLELASLRPKARPEALAAQAIARIRADEAAVDAAVAEVIAQGDIVNATEQAVAASPQPDHRPRNFASIVASARADTSDGSTVVAASAAPTITPAIPTRASVATHATITNAIRLHDINLIGIYGSSSSRRALVRLKNGRYVKVSVGERLNGGKVVSITEKRLIYTKNGRNYTLELIALG